MMEVNLDGPMAEARRLHGSATPRRGNRSAMATAAAATLAAGIWTPGAGLAADEALFPSTETLRQVQLAALACARENNAASCDQARQLADPLLDHARLPTACKDQLWAISQRSTVAATNSFSRREGIAEPAQLIVLSCRSGEKPAAAAPAAAPASGGGGLKFGGS